MDKQAMKDKFYQYIKNTPQKANGFRMTTERYTQLINDVKSAKSAQKKENRHFWLLKHYDTVYVGNVDKLIAPIADEKVLYYVTVEELFEVLYETHLSIGHGGRDRMKKELNLRFKNITAQDIQTFLNNCEVCLKKRANEKKGLVVKPMVFSHFNSRCQVDLIDFQSQPDDNYKFILVYQDHLTKFIILRALKNKTAYEVADQLLQIFLLFGAPSILQSDNGREFVNHVIDDFKGLWPELKIVHGKPRHSQSQGSVERANQDIENILTAWMQHNQTSNWSRGLGYVQFMKNRTLHAGIKRSPYEAMFGQPAKVGLTSSCLPHEVLSSINSEEDLENILKNINCNEESVQDHRKV